MGKMKSLLQDYEETYGIPFDYIDESDLYEFQQMQHEEELMRQGVISCPLLEGIEQDSYQQYMEGKLCGDKQNIAPTSTDTNLKDGQTAVGLRRKRRIVK